MKKYVALALTMIMGITVLAGCGTPKEEVPPTQGDGEQVESEGETEEKTTFTMGFDASYPPYGYIDEAGEYVGFDIDLATEVCERRGWELVKRPIDWDAKDLEINSGSIDCIWNGFTMTEREDSYTFTDAYVDNSIVFVVRAEDTIETAADLADKVVMTQTDSSAYTALTATEDNDENLALAATFSALEVTADYNTAFMTLESGAIDAIAVDIGVAQYQLSSRDGIFKMLEEPFSKEQYGIGFKKGNTELRDQVQETLYEMVEDGTFDEIVSNYAEYNLDQMVSLGK